jgi:triosephosphate isomerase (TIM)
MCVYIWERRVFRNDDKAINRKVRAVLDHDMRPILCVGESKEEYDAGLVKAVS